MVSYQWSYDRKGIYMKGKQFLRRIVCILAACLVLCTGLSAAQAKETLQNKSYVLFISSYSLSFDTVPLQIKGLTDVLTQEKADLDIEFMDTKRFGEAQDIELFYQFLRNKLEKHVQYDVVIVGDDAALQFVLNYKEEFFSEIPIIFLGINSLELAEKADEDPCITGIIEDTSYHQNIDLALCLCPHAVEIVAIVDNTLTGKGDQEQFERAVKDYPQLKSRMINASEHTTEELVQALCEINPESIVLFLTMFEDAEGNSYTIKQGVEFISQYVNAPVFRLSVGGVGEGLLGGIMVSYEISGQVAGEMAERILDGASASEIEMVTTSPNYGFFDQNVLDRYGISTELLPEGSIIINQKQSFFEKNKTMVISLLIVCSISVLIMGILFWSSIRRKRLLEQDFLTKLYNRMWMTKHLETVLSKQRKCAVLMLDIDDFKQINDSLGHASGDELLIETADYFRTISNKEYTVARFGGDEFLGILNDSNHEKIEEYVKKMRAVFEQSFRIGNRNIEVHASLGIACAPEDGTSAEELIANADAAMYSAKNSGKNGYHFFDRRIKDALNRQEQVKGYLQEAINQDGFELLYQPQVCSEDSRLAGFEALLRLKDGRAFPGEFIPIAEQNGMIIKIGRVVTEKVIRQLAEWKKKSCKVVPVALNFSNIQLRDTEYPGYIDSLLKKYGVEPELLEIEITESVFLERSEEAIQYLEAIRDLGINMSLDDFGTGYSAISYLNYIPVCKLKLDKSLLDEYHKTKELRMIEGVVNMAHALKLRVVAEGVEEEDQAEMIRSVQCDYIQGFYYSKPVSTEEAERLLDKNYFFRKS